MNEGKEKKEKVARKEHFIGHLTKSKKDNMIYPKSQFIIGILGN